MKFGHLTNINQVDFSLPPDPPENLTVLRKNKITHDSFQFFFGSARWGEKDLIGKIYPPKTATRDYLHYYSRHFSCIEMNTTHYRIPTKDMVIDWRKKTAAHFKFCPKLPQSISHSKDFGKWTKATEQFVEAVGAFEDQLGMPFMQLPPEFSPQQGRELFDYLKDWPREIPLAVEFRHPDWFAQERLKNRAFTLLEEQGIIAVITDTAGRRDVVHQRLTTPKTLIRFVGNRLHPSDYQRIDNWVQRIKHWKEEGLAEIYFIVHQPEEHLCVDLAIYLVEQINAVCQLTIAPPRTLSLGEQQSLF